MAIEVKAHSELPRRWPLLDPGSMIDNPDALGTIMKRILIFNDKSIDIVFPKNSEKNNFMQREQFFKIKLSKYKILKCFLLSSKIDI